MRKWKLRLIEKTSEKFERIKLKSTEVEPKNRERVKRETWGRKLINKFRENILRNFSYEEERVK